jgi:hypothetical protein
LENAEIFYKKAIESDGSLALSYFYLCGLLAAQPGRENEAIYYGEEYLKRENRGENAERAKRVVSALKNRSK